MEMESTTVKETTTVTERIVRVPVEVGTAIVDGVETIGHEVAKDVVLGAAVVVEAAQTVGTDIAEASKQLGHEVKGVVTPSPVPAPPTVTPVEAAAEA
jgi:hypothetical protein